jgi:hypothetical protein
MIRVRPRRMRGAARFGAALLLGAACAPAPVGDAAVARGREIVAPFKTELQRALLEGLERGPVDAIAVCQIQAPRIAAERAGDGVELGRTSHRLRNPANAPRGWVEPLLADYLSGAVDLEPRAVRLSAERVGYVEPIRVQAVCLPCHGDPLAPEVASEIRRRYPDDRATGFAIGDFRGVFWAELPWP